MLNKLILFLLMILFLNACQTHFPIVSQMEDSDNISCPKNIDQIELADIDYLLYANRMIDAMIRDHKVQKELTTNRMKLSIQPISHQNNTAKVDMATVNTAIKNRILRSGQFIIVKDEQSSDVQLSGVFENKKIHPNNCVENYEQFSMQLKNSQSGRIIWSEKKQFK